MQAFEIPKDIDLSEFFESFVPEAFNAIVSEKPIPGMDGTEFTLQVNLTGEGGSEYGIRVRNAREMEIAKGSIENPMLEVIAPYLAWRAGISGDIKGAEMLTDPARFAGMVDREMYEAAKSTRGTVIFKPVLGEDLDVQIRIIFNGAEQPAVTLSAAPEVLYAMSTGELGGPEAFLQNKLKIDGDITFAMRLNTFMRFAG
jgi:SCP-2 sterol transfer family